MRFFHFNITVQNTFVSINNNFIHDNVQNIHPWYQTTEQDLVAGVKRLGNEARRALEQLNMYHAITGLYPSVAKSQHRVNMYSAWGNKILENFSVETCDEIAAEFAGLFSAQPTRVRELRSQQVLSVNTQLEKWNSELVSSLQRCYQRMMSENIMKQGKAGVLVELGNIREMVSNQLNHPDSGVRPETLICFFLKSILASGSKWSELERNYAENAEDRVIDALFLEARITKTLMETGDMLHIITKNPHMTVLDSLCNVLVSLENLSASFSTIIMPEGIKNFMQDDASVIEMCELVEDIITSGGLAIEELKHETRLHTRCCMLAMESSHLAAVELVISMRHRYQELVTSAGMSEAMTTGQMLLCAVNSLLNKVDTDMTVLRGHTLAVAVPPECGKFDLVRSAAEVSSAAFNPTSGVWDSLMSTLFVSKLELLRNFLNTCRLSSVAFRCDNIGQQMPTGKNIISSVKKYIAEYVQLMILGTGPRHLAAAVTQFSRDSSDPSVTRFFEMNQGKEKLSIEDLWQALMEEKMATGALNQARIAKSGVMMKNLASIVHKWELAGQLDCRVEALSAAQQVNALQHAGVQWYHEEYIPRELNIKPAEPVR